MSQLVFDKYEVIRRIAIGGMGEVFLVRQHGIPGFERLAILKNLLPDLARQEGFVEMFLDEARVAATLNHPNIVAIYEVGKWSGTYHIAMEFIRGESLSNILLEADAKETRIPLPVAAQIIHDSALALDHAHHAKDVNGKPLELVHRDISPQNIMVRDDGVTKVVDFGIAKAANRATRTATGNVKGKLAYMAPEQARGLKLDGRCDQFALGIVFWEMCAGQRLFKGDNAAETLQNVLSKKIRRPGDVADGVPPLVEAIVMRLLERDPANRFERCRDASDGLKVYLNRNHPDHSNEGVAEFVERVCGDRIDEMTRDLTPGDDFVIPLGRPSADRDAATILLPGEPTAMKPSDDQVAAASPLSRRWFLLGGAALAGGLAVAASVAFYARPSRAPIDDGAADRAGADHAEPAIIEPPTTARASPVLIIQSHPSGAEVTMGGNIVGQTPLELSTLPAGTHTLTLAKAGYKPREVQLTLRSGETHRESITLEARRGEGRQRRAAKRGQRPARTVQAAKSASTKPAGVTPVVREPAIGFLTLNTIPWTTVYLGDSLLGEIPIAKKALPVGSHTLRFVNAKEKIDERRTVEIRAGQLSKVQFNFE